MREVVLDTETTGLNPYTGDRLVELGCVELLNSIPTGENFHAYINPQRNMPEEAYRIHGLSEEFLKHKPKFSQVADDFLAFIGDAKLVIHNAEFDMKFINHELSMMQYPPIQSDRIVDTLLIARRKFPGSPNSLDALCNRFRIDNSRRTKHGALLDSEILAEVYLELTGGRQTVLTLQQDSRNVAKLETIIVVGKRPVPLSREFDSSILDTHRALVDQIGKRAVWHHYITDEKNKPI